MNDLVERLRRHDDVRLYREADVLMSEAANEIERLRKIEAAAKNLISRTDFWVGCLPGEYDDLVDLLLEESLK